MQNKSEQLVESELLQVTKAVEKGLDDELTRLENLDEDDLEVIRQQRLKQMKEESKQRAAWLANGHGVYSELATERDFFNACKTSAFGIVCHFYRESTFRCKIVDKHLALLAPKHVECRMVKIDAEKSPFLTKRLAISVIPTLILVKNEKVCDRIVGFDDLGGRDEFSTAMLEWRLACGEVIKYSGDLSTPPLDQTTSKKLGLANKRVEHKTIRAKCISDSDCSD